MKKFLFFAIALVASALVFTSCDKNDPKHPIKGVKFVCDYDRGGYAREYLYFGNGADFEWGWEVYEDEARKTLISATGDYGTYVVNDEQQYIDMTFNGGFEIVNGERVTHAGQAVHNNGRWYYRMDGDTIFITAENGYTTKYWKK